MAIASRKSSSLSSPARYAFRRRWRPLHQDGRRIVPTATMVVSTITATDNPPTRAGARRTAWRSFRTRIARRWRHRRCRGGSDHRRDQRRRRRWRWRTGRGRRRSDVAHRRKGTAARANCFEWASSNAIARTSSSRESTRARLPPGQYTTDRFPVLHVGDIPEYEPGQWDLTIHGLVDMLPSVVLMLGEREIDRIVGYWGPESFCKLLAHKRAKVGNRSEGSPLSCSPRRGRL